jgi:hypothetical protein
VAEGEAQELSARVAIGWPSERENKRRSGLCAWGRIVVPGAALDQPVKCRLVGPASRDGERSVQNGEIGGIDCGGLGVGEAEADRLRGLKVPRGQHRGRQLLGICERRLGLDQLYDRRLGKPGGREVGLGALGLAKDRKDIGLRRRGRSGRRGAEAGRAGGEP